MAYTLKIELNRQPLSLQTDGTYFFVGCDDGKIKQITIADNTTVVLANLGGKKITAIVTDGTYLYVGCDDGTLSRVTLADGTVTAMEPKSKAQASIVSIHYYTTTLYLGLNNGQIVSRSTTP